MQNYDLWQVVLHSGLQAASSGIRCPRCDEAGVRPQWNRPYLNVVCYKSGCDWKGGQKAALEMAASFKALSPDVLAAVQLDATKRQPKTTIQNQRASASGQPEVRVPLLTPTTTATVTEPMTDLFTRPFDRSVGEDRVMESGMRTPSAMPADSSDAVVSLAPSISVAAERLQSLENGVNILLTGLSKTLEQQQSFEQRLSYVLSIINGRESAQAGMTTETQDSRDTVPAAVERGDSQNRQPGQTLGPHSYAAVTRLPARSLAIRREPTADGRIYLGQRRRILSSIIGTGPAPEAMSWLYIRNVRFCRISDLVARFRKAGINQRMVLSFLPNTTTLSICARLSDLDTISSALMECGIATVRELSPEEAILATSQQLAELSPEDRAQAAKQACVRMLEQQMDECPRPSFRQFFAKALRKLGEDAPSRRELDRRLEQRQRREREQSNRLRETIQLPECNPDAATTDSPPGDGTWHQVQSRSQARRQQRRRRLQEIRKRITISAVTMQVNDPENAMPALAGVAETTDLTTATPDAIITDVPRNGAEDGRGPSTVADEPMIRSPIGFEAAANACDTDDDYADAMSGTSNDNGHGVVEIEMAQDGDDISDDNMADSDAAMISVAKRRRDSSCNTPSPEPSTPMLSHDNNHHPIAMEDGNNTGGAGPKRRVIAQRQVTAALVNLEPTEPLLVPTASAKTGVNAGIVQTTMSRYVTPRNSCDHAPRQ
jgi:hypothetical protein